MKTIPTFRLKPEPLNEAAKNLPKFKWAGDNIGTRHQLGGEPTYIQAKIHPVCPDCKEKMTFYAHRRHSFCGHFPLRKNLPSIHHHHGAGWALTLQKEVFSPHQVQHQKNQSKLKMMKKMKF